MQKQEPDFFKNAKIVKSFYDDKNSGKLAISPDPIHYSKLKGVTDDDISFDGWVQDVTRNITKRLIHTTVIIMEDDGDIHIIARKCPVKEGCSTGSVSESFCSWNVGAYLPEEQRTVDGVVIDAVTKLA